MAQPPSPTWSATYRHDRRKHRHRCLHCRRVLNAGEAVLMAKVSATTTRAVHEACAAQPHGVDRPGAPTVGDAMVAWGTAYLRDCGWKLPEVRLPSDFDLDQIAA